MSARKRIARAIGLNSGPCGGGTDTTAILPPVIIIIIVIRDAMEVKFRMFSARARVCLHLLFIQYNVHTRLYSVMVIYSKRTLTCLRARAVYLRLLLFREASSSRC